MRGGQASGHGCREAKAPVARLSWALPGVSGEELVGALEKMGWVAVRQHGRHVRLRQPD